VHCQGWCHPLWIRIGSCRFTWLHWVLGVAAAATDAFFGHLALIGAAWVAYVACVVCCHRYLAVWWRRRGVGIQDGIPPLQPVRENPLDGVHVLISPASLSNRSKLGRPFGRGASLWVPHTIRTFVVRHKTVASSTYC
jgi:hypothetical protein